MKTANDLEIIRGDIHIRICWSEALLVAHAKLLEISCHGSIIVCINALVYNLIKLNTKIMLMVTNRMIYVSSDFPSQNVCEHHESIAT